MAIFTPELLNKLKWGYYFWPMLLLGGLIGTVLNYIYSLWNMKRVLKWIPGPPQVPILGNAVNFIGKPWTEHWKLTTQWLKKYDGLAQIWIFHRPTVLISRSDVVERLLKGTADTLMLKGEQYNYMREVFGDGLLTLSAVEWHERRKIISPCFQDDSLGGFIPTVCHHARALTSHLANKKSDTVDIQQYTKLSALDLTMDSLLKTSPNFLEHPNNSYIDAIKATTDLSVKRSYTPLYNWSFIYFFTLSRLIQAKASKTINDFAKKVIQRRKKAFDEKKMAGENDHKEQTFLDFLLDKVNKKLMNETEVQQEVNTFLFAGHDTISSGVAFTLYLIGCHPEIQEKVQREIEKVLPNLNEEKEPTMEQLNKLDLLERCIKESLRLYPPVPWIGRVLKNYIKIGDNQTLPEGANIAISIYNLHRNENNYKNPNHFQPDRFLHEVKDSDDNFNYIPFGAGWRHCIGQKFALLEMKIIISHILNKYSITSIDKPEDLEITGNAILRSCNGLKVRFHLRNI